jgi:hypothetical protein
LRHLAAHVPVETYERLRATYEAHLQAAVEADVPDPEGGGVVPAARATRHHYRSTTHASRRGRRGSGRERDSVNSRVPV